MTEVQKKEEEAGRLTAIIAAAQKQFGQYGLVKTTMNDIAAEIGLGKATLYYYFPNKETLFEAVILKEQTEFIEEITKTLKSTSSAIVLLKQYLKKRQAYFERCHNLSKLKYDSLKTTHPLVCKLIGGFYQQEVLLISSILKKGMDNGEFKQINAGEDADFLVITMQGLRLAMLKRKNDSIMEKEDYLQLNKHMTRVVDLFVSDIRPI